MNNNPATNDMHEDLIELTVLMPCLNEAETIERCIHKALRYMKGAGIKGEVLIADNGSIDGSQRLAELAGARVIGVANRGYGEALRAGIVAARGRYVIMGDADDSYDFSNLTHFITALRSGSQLVMGNRFKGGIQPGAMPPLHRYLGNPVLSYLGRLFFRTDIRDFHCGLRGFNRSDILNLGLNTSGMEFASEMVVKATLVGLRVTEVPTTLFPDGRNRPPHLRSWRDGWRHLRFLLFFSPRWLFLYPGLIFAVVGMALTTILYFTPISIGKVVFDINTMLYASAAFMVGLQMLLLAIYTKLFGIRFGLLPTNQSFLRIIDMWTLERGLLVGMTCFLAGIGWAIYTVYTWGEASFQALDPRIIMRQTIPAATLTMLGMEIAIASFFMGVLRLSQGNFSE